MGNVKKSVAKRARHQRQYDKSLNKRQMQMQESKIDTGKAVDVDLVVTESSRTKSEEQDDSNKLGNDTDADNADIKPICDEELMAEKKVYAIAALKNDLRKLKGNSVDTNFAKSSVLGNPVLQSLRNQSVVRKPNVFKSERPQMLKPRFAVDVNNNLSRLEVNSRAKIQSHKTRNSNKLVDQKSHTLKPGRWKPTGRIFKSVGLRWIPT
uniref:Uncharacterized protein n=1 Tax=Tanacetum cinerariifolium TaxID=118510 RepID=A0A699HW12_TANCI|nr:hypothetical protein [Tanacetum cinerariifolium]